MHAASERRLLVVWLALSAITLVSLWLGHRGGATALTPNAVVGSGAIVIALVKTRIILREFMEVRHAPRFLGRITDIWLLVTAVSLVGTYLVGLALSK